MAERSEVLFSRYQDGARPVRVLEGGWEVVTDKGEPTLFTTAQGLLAELTGHPKGRHWSLDRYFGLGRYSPTTDKLLGQANILDLFPVPATGPKPVLLKPLAPAILAFKRNTPDPAITVPAGPSQAVPGGLVVTGALGIDLAARGHEVRKLFYAGFGRRVNARGYDPDDVLQEVYKKLLVSNKGKCPWDPSKSSFGHYVYMVCGCVLSNYHRKQRRRRQFEQLGMGGITEDDSYGNQDVSGHHRTPAPESTVQSEMLLLETADDLVDYMLTHPKGRARDARLAVDVLPYVVGETPRAHIAERLGLSMAAVSRAVSHLRAAALAWRQSLA